MAKTNKKKAKKKNLKPWIIALVTLIVALLAGAGVKIKIDADNLMATIDYAPEAEEVEITDEGEIEKIEGGQGEVKIDGEEIPTVETVESNGPVNDLSVVECPEGEECGRGAAYPTLDISSPQAFANATLGQCINVDGVYGSQCWDSMAAFWYNYTGRTLSTCGTGAAKGTIQDGCWQKNAGSEFTMIWDAKKVQAGDIAVYSGGQWGHIGMAMGAYNNGYFTLLGQNQGGKSCPGGGAAGNIINLSTKNFIGAFRPNIYIKPEPKPEPTPEPTPEPDEPGVVLYEVKKGDTLAKIMKQFKGKIEWGEAMNEYARHWTSEKLNKGKTVFYGWTHGSGYGLFAGDVIRYDK